MSDTSVCTCDLFQHPRPITNPPGSNHIVYRVGDYTAFRHALLIPLPDETALAGWRPGAHGDLAVQMVEWWAYLADILTFYNERIATQSYLRTADLPDSVTRLIQVLGYRPRPGIAAEGLIAALLNSQNGNQKIVLPQGWKIQSKPGPGKQPQTFELDRAITLTPPDAVNALPPPDPRLTRDGKSVLLAGTISGIQKGDNLLLVERNWAGGDSNYAWVRVESTSTEPDTFGKLNTRLTFTTDIELPADAMAANYRLLRPLQSQQIWRFDSNSVAHATSLLRPVKPGDILLFESISIDLIKIGTVKSKSIKAKSISTDTVQNTVQDSVQEIATVESLVARDAELLNTLFSPVNEAVIVRGLVDRVGYKQADGTYIDHTTDPTKVPPYPVLHTQITFAPALSTKPEDSSATVYYDWRDVGELIATPSSLFVGTNPTLVSLSPSQFPPLGTLDLIVEGADGNGIAATGVFGTSPSTTVKLDKISDPDVALPAPLRLLFGLLPVSRGESVGPEILGSGDATLSGQRFILKRSPLTYLQDGAGYKSTLQVSVNGVRWKEVESFYGISPGAEIYVTREDEQGRTQVLFGDGVNGARLPSGTNNVVATYRIGSGAETPDPGTLTVITSPRPGIKALRAPLPLKPGSDADPPEQIRRYAPNSVLAFGRAVSAEDYETIAAQAPGVTRARAYWIWNSKLRREMVTVYVGDGEGALQSAKTALLGAADPNRPLSVQLAIPVVAKLSLALHIDPRYDGNTLKLAVQSALLDPQTGLFGAQRARIGQSIYRSQIEATCLSIPGVLATHALDLVPRPLVEGRYGLQEGEYFQLDASDLAITVEEADHAL